MHRVELPPADFQTAQIRNGPFRTIDPSLVPQLLVSAAGCHCCCWLWRYWCLSNPAQDTLRRVFWRGGEGRG